MPRILADGISLALCLLAVASGAAELTVDNPLDAPQSRTVRFEEVWRAGDDDTAEYIFGVILDVAEDESGNIYLLDTQQQQVFKFSAAGQYCGLVSRRGQGPGEIENVYGMRYIGGGRLGLLKVFPTSLVRVDTLGLPLSSLSFVIDSPAEEIQFGGVYSFEGWGDTFYGYGQFLLRDKSRGQDLQFLSSFDSDGEEIHRFDDWYGGYDFTKPIKVDEKDAYHPLITWDCDRAGRIYHTVARDSYLVEVRNPDGSLVRRIQRQWNGHRRTKAEKEAVKDQYSFSSNAELPPISYKIADMDPAIADLKIVGDELWIFSPQAARSGQHDGAWQADVFDLKGHLLEARTMVVPHDPENDSLHYLPSGRVLRIKNLNSALASQNPDHEVQSGEKRRVAEDLSDEGILEVIVYRPLVQ